MRTPMADDDHAEDLYKVLLLDGAADTEWIETMLADSVGAAPSAIVHCETTAALLGSLHTAPFDLVLVGMHKDPAHGLEAIRAIRDADPAIPILAVTGHCDREAGLLAIRAGAQDYVARSESTSRRLAQTIDYAIERNRLRHRIEVAKETEAREQEFNSLKNLCGPAPLPISGRSFGSIPLRDRSPQAFLDLARQYEKLILVASTSTSLQHREQIADDLNVIADRLGVLNAGPRDVIDLHKMAISKRLEGLSVGRARSAIEDGRMMLLQLMGYLVSFYRNLSWGTASRRAPGSPGRLLANPEATARKNKT